MSYDVFISYATVDKHVADAVCSTLENSSIRCWIAPRDIIPGNDWAQSIADAIKSSKIMILVFSQNSNDSPQVSKELNLAVTNKLMVIPFKIDNCTPSGNMEYFLADTHWLDAIDGDMQGQINKLKGVVVSVLPHSIKSDNSEEKTGQKTEEEASTVTAEKTVIKKEKPAKKKTGIFASYINLWKKCFDYRGTTAVSELLKAELMHIAVNVLLVLIVFSLDSEPLAKAWVIYALISIIPFCAMLVRAAHGEGKGVIKRILKAEAAHLPLVIFWFSVAAGVSGPTFAELWLLYTVLWLAPVISEGLGFMLRALLKKRQK